MEIAYGHHVTSIDDKYIALAEKTTVETILAGSPGSMLVDFFPIRACTALLPPNHFLSDFAQ